MMLVVMIFMILAMTDCLSPDKSDYEALQEENGSRSLTKELLNLDLGYNVLNSEVLRKSLGNVQYDSSSGEEEVEELPSASALVQDMDFSSNLRRDWNGGNSDEKFWNHGPSPFFFPDFGFGRPRPVSAQAVRPHPPLRHVPARHRPPPPPALLPKTFVGDQHQCATGACEFILFCWLGGGIIEGPCGGFLFACCQRPDGGGRNSEAIVEKVSFFWTTHISYHFLYCLSIQNAFFLVPETVLITHWKGLVY